MSGNRSEPILIIGPPRSGSTLLATMLNAHPRLFIANEAKVFVSLLPAAQGRVAGESLAGKWLADLERNELAAHAPLPGAREVLSNTGEATVPGFLRSLFELLARQEGKVRWGEKTAVAYRQLQAIRSAFPDAKLIALDRDPAQIAASYAKMIPKWGALGGLMDWIDFRRAIAGGPQGSSDIHMVSYEGLIRDSEATLRQVCEFVGEEFAASMLEYFKTPRAKELESSPVFAGAARPIYREGKPAAPTFPGFQARLAKRLIEVGNRTGEDLLHVPVWERALRAALFVKASFWELRQPDFAQRLLRTLRHRTQS